MYKALAFKELRETAWIGGIVFAAMVWVVLEMIGGRADPVRLLWFGVLPLDPLASRRIPFLHPDLMENLAWITTAGGLALGFRQVLGETFRGTWLFLLHRPAPRAAILLTKLAVGAGLLVAATAIPVLILAFWAATPGTHASPFDWRMTDTPLRLCVGATCVYLAAFLSALRDARWYGTRLLPLVFAGLTVFWIYNFVWWPIAGWIIMLTADALYLAAILHTARVREY